ncbi:hypothetical protein BDP55DRAFT_716933 [Colletotrichum godetiae]|uniref:Uncharacterized protein n=1 Tax=Colletotrichum godetiae TaxID=1209918 RepID=A0AAJ0AGX5_9PEZI|nr:uncharacterized protein BDP55DRAFT_716933 [Colletotrichum godetiae]KAK1673699.1 hypothetical protein BDP55DRAFT_716933 [Colletotrichum godetiae]
MDADQARLEAIRADEIRNEDLTPRKRGYTYFGAPVVPASANTTSKVRGEGDAQEQLERGVGTGQSGGLRVREALSSTQMRPSDRAPASVRGNLIQGMPRRHAPLPQPTYEEGYKGYKEEMEVRGARTRTYDEQQAQLLEEDGNDVDDFDDFDEAAARNSQAAEYEGKDDDYDD